MTKTTTEWKPKGDSLKEYELDAAAYELQELALNIARRYVRKPDRLCVSVDRVDERVSLTADPDPGDVGRMVGGVGKMFHSTAALLHQAARRLGVSVHYCIQQPERPVRGDDSGPFKARADWPERELKEDFDGVLGMLFDHELEVRWVNEPGKTRVHVLLHADEPKRLPDAELRDALSAVLHAAGANNGRRIYVETLARAES